MTDIELKILIVEDETPKITQIELFLRSLCMPMAIKHAKSVNSALDVLEGDIPHLILLDMSLPTMDIDIPGGEAGGRPQGFGGIEILRNMEFSGISCPVIVITGYEAFPRQGGSVDISGITQELKEEFPQLLHSVLHYTRHGLMADASESHSLQ
ncbi:response regulator [Pseudomonas sp. D8002]|uniref:response regulator n=1 Tax=Pseudomonas sp. D8002 TaxID=2738816 RepID=UPI00159FE2EA|nr:response regulator [Pseudomonas sp. D8002]NWA91462.1 response regulator [Pseudomonas sp. D8002]